MTYRTDVPEIRFVSRLSVLGLFGLGLLAGLSHGQSLDNWKPEAVDRDTALLLCGLVQCRVCGRIILNPAVRDSITRAKRQIQAWDRRSCGASRGK